MEIVCDLSLRNAECPVWNPIDQKLYWSDIPNGCMYRLDTTGPVLVHEAGQALGSLVVAEDGSIIQGLEEGRVQRWHEGKVSVICEGIPAERGRRFNDGAADPAGRVLLGTMPGDGPASVYVFEADGRHRLLIGDLGQANGTVFSNAGNILYVTDTQNHVILKCRYSAGGFASQCRPLIQVPDAKPDGLTIDDQGNLWSAHWGGGCVVQYSATGKELQRIAIPVKQVSSLTFGGPDLETLFITTAGGDDRPAKGPLAGSIFALKPGVRGGFRRLAYRGN